MHDKVRLGIIGLGNMGGAHAGWILGGQVPRCELAAVCDINPAKLAPFPGIWSTTDSAELIRSGRVDAVLIATPHYFHTTIGIDALTQGLHVLTEKPISVHKADCERLIAAYQAKVNKGGVAQDGTRQIFSAMFNQRTDPHYIKLKRLIDGGELGRLQRVSWIITNWFRTETYYASSGWRATWAGEGGGVLLNQCPHQLDLWQWLFGLPRRVRAACHLGKYHRIEVEDEVTAYLEYDNGMTGVFITTTGEWPGTNRLEVAGDRGKVVIEGDGFSFTRNETPASEFNQTSKESFAAPDVWNIEIPIQGGCGPQHIGILKNFTAAILDGAPLIAPAEEGIRSVELGNAMIFSSMMDKTIELPLDGAAYETMLRGLIEKSTLTRD